MEGTNSEAVFESLNLSPQLFINEVLNIVDDLLDEAFNFFLQEASALLKTDDTDRSAELTKGVAYIRDLIQSTLDQRMQKWEEYCLRFCFTVPEGFALPKAVGKESADLSIELRALERLSLSSNLSAGSIDEAVQLYKEHDATQMFQELTTMASEFHMKLGNLKRKRVEEMQCEWLQNVKHGDVLRIPRGNGLSRTKLEELQEFLDEITTV